jgi:hypothetical protein
MTDKASPTEYAAAAAVYGRLLDIRTWLREVERGARRRNPFGRFRVIPFRHARRD